MFGDEFSVSSRPWLLLKAREYGPWGPISCVYTPPFPEVHNRAAEMTVWKCPLL